MSILVEQRLRMFRFEVFGGRCWVRTSDLCRVKADHVSWLFAAVQKYPKLTHFLRVVSCLFAVVVWVCTAGVDEFDTNQASRSRVSVLEPLDRMDDDSAPRRTAVETFHVEVK